MSWTAVSLSRDVPAGATAGVVLEGREIVLWRGSDHDIHAWEDRCPHRGMRLSFGFVRGTTLNCLYHGWQYGSDTGCLLIPAHPDLVVPGTIRANAYPVREAGGLVWVALEDTDAPLPALPPEAVPIATVAVWADIEVPPTIAVAGGTLHLFAHRSRPATTMVHGIVDGPEARAAGWAEIRVFRDTIEREAAA